MEPFNCPNCGKEEPHFPTLCSECRYPLFIESAENFVANIEKISFALNFNMILGGLILIVGSTIVPVYYFGIEDVRILGPLMMMVTFPGAVFFVLGICIFALKFLLKLWRNKIKPKLLKRLGFHNVIQNVRLAPED